METVNKYVHAASNAIWGEDGTANATQITQQHGEEPLSGVQGTGNATDPFDAGNRDEQPDAPKSDSNTAPQDPVVGSKQESSEEAALTSAKVPASNVPIIGGKPQSFEETAVTSDPTPKTTTVDTEDTSPSTAAAASSNTAQPMFDGSTESKKETSTSDKEQRSSSNPEGEGESSESSHPAAHVDASKEALEGPQGPPPSKTAGDFENESKGKKSAAASNDVEKTPTSESKDTNKTNESEHSQESGKSGKLAKVKESVKKHLHHSSK